MKLSEEIAEVSSILIAFTITAFVLFAISTFIEDVDQTPYPKVVTALICYVGIGMLITLLKDKQPPSSKKIQDGAIDVNFGFRALYWACWWPKLIKNKS